MQWSYKQTDEEVSYTIVETAVAVRPRRGTARARTPKAFGVAARDVSASGHFGLALHPDTLETFENAGWLFVEPMEPVRRAAAERLTVSNARAVRQVVVNSSGDLMITTDLVTVQVLEDLSEDEAVRVLKEDGLKLLSRLRFAPNLFEARLPARRPLPELIGELQAKTDRYHFVNPELLQIITGRSRPNDPEYAKQWHHNDGTGGGTNSADIRSEVAWSLTRGAGPDRPVRIAVIDNGMQINHPDLRDGIKSGGFFEENNADSKRARFFRLRPGMTNFPNKSTAHGTFCLGMAGARANNKRGGCGSAPEADLMPIACLEDQVGKQVTLARAVSFAANPALENENIANPAAGDVPFTPADGADVISCSLGRRAPVDWKIEPALRLAIIDAARNGRSGRGVPIFWSVSNHDIELARDQVCSQPDVIAVGRSDRTNSAGGTAFGPKLELLAPGVGVFGISLQGEELRSDTGTSFATPLAAGVAALIISRNPNIRAEEVRARLRETCDKIGNVQYDANRHHDRFGFGRINAGKAVQ